MPRKVAIVTGASSGMGAALSTTLVSAGWHVAMADITPNATLLTALQPHATFHRTDVSSYASQAKTFLAVHDTHGRIDALCANAGVVDRSSLYLLGSRGAKVEDIPAEPDLSCTDIDYKGVVYGTQLAVHFMRFNPTPGGAIVATASIAAVHPHPSYPEYNGAKAAVLNFMRGVKDVLWMKEGIRMNCVLPGIVETAIIPKEMVEAVSPECITPIKTVTDAYIRLLEDPSIYGEAIECSAKSHFFFPEPEMSNGRITRRAVTVWEPLFKMLHGEDSELPDAIA
ncbi:hypothetical protein PRZ48_002791 [Zasmidium cellare]|uniref:15-hydroxyprostaglandin dehydrogenase n=1 Tax=Zasmidium cellare TaxID=395010 RepID=A0ABR0ET68_ZASCE|nr:hypothetical protein PRZ48_002791 [Zasmidium cellare]